MYDRVASRAFTKPLLCHTYKISPSFKVSLFPLITSYEVLVGITAPFRINALVAPLTILADTEMLPPVLLQSNKEVTRAKFFCQSWVADGLAGTVIIRPASAPSELVGAANLFVLVLEGRIVAMVTD